MTEKQADDRAQPPAPIARAVPIRMSARVISGALGTLMATAGVWAIIRSGKEGAGVVALIITALLLWLVCLIGRVPHRVWGKDIGYDMGDIDIPQEEADAIAEMPAELRDAVWSVLDSLVLSAREGEQVFPAQPVSGMARVSSSQRELAAFEERCRWVLNQTVSSIRDPSLKNLQLDLHAESLLDRGVGDALIRSDYGIILFDFKVRLYETSARRLLAAYAQWRSENPQPSRLIILADSSTATAKAVLDFTDDDIEPHVTLMEIPQGSATPARLTRTIAEVVMSMKREKDEGAADIGEDSAENHRHE